MAVCCICQDEQISSSLKSSLQRCGFAVIDSSEQDIPISLPEQEIDAYVVDIEVIGPSVPWFRNLANRAPLIAFDRKPTIEKAVLAMRNGAFDYFPFTNIEEVLDRIQTGLNNLEPSSEELELSQRIVGDSTSTCQLRSNIRKVGPTKISVFVEGATGTGKDLVAKCIHDSSDRAHGPFVTLNCDRIPREILLEEMFGDTSKDGRTNRVLAANQGTLLLNEIGSLPPQAQVRLVRLLENNELQHHPSNQTQPVDVRVIATSNMPVDSLFDQEDYGNNLRLRFSGFVVSLSPLSERGDDIKQIAQMALDKHSKNLDRSGLSFHPTAIDRLQSYDWPGNVRELDQAIERSVLLSENSVIGPESFGISVYPPSQREDEQDDSGFTSLEDYFIDFVRSNEEKYTETELAEKLGISRKSLWERRNRLGFPRKRTRIKRPHW